jgi:hypothetical protein
MDNTAFHELIAHIRGTAAELAVAEQKVAAFKAELAQQLHGAQLGSALQRAMPMQPLPKRVSGWVPADTSTLSTTRTVTKARRLPAHHSNSRTR